MGKTKAWARSQAPGGAMRPAALLLLLLGGALGGCGGAGPGVGRAGDLPELEVLESVGGEDGWVRNDGVADPQGGGPAVGDLDNPTQGLAVRMFLSFDLTVLPPGAVVTGATLRVFTTGQIGQPYTDLGPLGVDHVDFGPLLDASDYAGNTLQQGVGVLATEHIARYRSLDVATQVQADLSAGRTRSQFRLRLPVDSNRDLGQDLVLVEDGERSRGTPNPPLLEVLYLLP